MQIKETKQRDQTKRPNKEYAASSSRLVIRFAAHDMRSATLNVGNGVPLRAGITMRVTA
jgi:hypothetical protein